MPERSLRFYDYYKKKLEDSNSSSKQKPPEPVKRAQVERKTRLSTKSRYSVKADK